jgi:hypothetical protein
LHIGCIDTKKYHDDSAFFKDLRTRNASVRGLLRHALSIWQPDHCHFVKVSVHASGSNPCDLIWYSLTTKYLPEVVSAVRKEHPEPSNYQYQPRPPDATPDEQIHYHIWSKLLYPPCSEGFLHRTFGKCPKMWLWNHDCLPELFTHQQRLLSRIPQRDSPWLKNTADIEDTWGLYVQNVPHLAYAIAYQLLFLLGPFVSLFISSRSRSDEGTKETTWDLQNASTPLSLAIGVLGTFWTWSQLLIPQGEIKSPYFD